MREPCGGHETPLRCRNPIPHPGRSVRRRLTPVQRRYESPLRHRGPQGGRGAAEHLGADPPPAIPRGGTNPSRVRQECRAGLVAILLERGLPVDSVARAVGLSGSQALGRFVRTFFGLTPSRLRAQLRSGAAGIR
ncbi:MAG: AraC family transcriptional regulator [Holophagales bacterium]|nr:AraC family transcriptional regulator [Holophagales bacterium]